MSRIRVLDLAKELGIETKAAIIKLQELGIQVKNHFNAISETEAAKLRAFHRSGKNPEKEAAQKAAASKLIIRRKVEAAPDSLETSGAKNNEETHSNDYVDQKSPSKTPAIIKKASKSREEDVVSLNTSNVDSVPHSEDHAVSEKKKQSSSEHKQVVKTPVSAGSQLITPDYRETKAASAHAQEASASRTDGLPNVQKGSEVGATAMRSQESDEINTVQTTNSQSSVH